MKYLIFSDIHGSAQTTEQILNIFKKEKCDKMIILGDYIYHGPRNPLTQQYNAMKVAELLNAYKDEIIGVRGNCDSEVDQMVLDFPCRNDYALICDNGINIFSTHGHVYGPNDLPTLKPIDLFLYGHTHVCEINKEGNTVVCNPGSITLPRGGNPPSYAIYENKNLTIYNFDTNEVIKILVLE
ncbi:YfcE family phosphodiesterase [Candidatus Epulonipiscium fishelsonii]|uniref:YfcE family phosphodiesterase n=1 Tax=Candidatus Epulonipiscium fishelsonii TaxID=77094 RepID=A0ACC8XAP7_9FIRM|nr:YfcE family phosphodiesterase [Epulopiscium sp. SCG-B05WGA-EpuloA1]ONI39571.1 YfcE family phosphodiesterase [Epulopiscium sp. SCG-B11WGA-EpuloA1]